MTTRALARKDDPATSHEAAEKVSRVVDKLERQILDALRRLGRPLTSREIAMRTGRELISISPRMKPLCEQGKVRMAGLQPQPGPRRRSRILWALTEWDEPSTPSAA